MGLFRNFLNIFQSKKKNGVRIESSQTYSRVKDESKRQTTNFNKTRKGGLKRKEKSNATEIFVVESEIVKSKRLYKGAMQHYLLSDKNNEFILPDKSNNLLPNVSVNLNLNEGALTKRVQCIIELQDYNT